MKIGFFGLLTIAFVVLKLTGYIAWSWWVVLAPLYPGITLFIAGMVLLSCESEADRSRRIFRELNRK